MKVIIAAAGMAAALPGVIAASTPLPVIGVPIKGMLDGLSRQLGGGGEGAAGQGGGSGLDVKSLLGGGALGSAPGITIFPEEFGIKVLTLPVGGFLTLGCLIAVMQWALAKSEKKKEAK